MTTSTITRTQRRAILAAANQRQANIAIEVIPGADLAPRTAGESWHYTTRTGQRIYHPSAYRRHGWSSMVYNCSSRRVEVGEHWLSAQGRIPAVQRAEISA